MTSHQLHVITDALIACEELSRETGDEAWHRAADALAEAMAPGQLEPVGVRRYEREALTAAGEKTE